MACTSLAKDPCLVVTTMFQTWLQWFKTFGSGVKWSELVTVKECCQLYKQYKGEDWIHPFDVHFALVGLEFLMEDLAAGMTVSALAVASASNTTKHPPHALVVATGVEWSKGCGNESSANQGDNGVAGDESQLSLSTIFGISDLAAADSSKLGTSHNTQHMEPSPRSGPR
ncbi:hypothetical protein H2248_006854 [Termitomyces sp. 'cryptogamus']|nr:hypothetical protein H2248_006854 [Termitomyces sp. 'cryptogamus']